MMDMMSMVRLSLGFVIPCWSDVLYILVLFLAPASRASGWAYIINDLGGRLAFLFFAENGFCGAHVYKVRYC
ncbi:hypothetical protein V8C44DRAFT_339667 [Trichoderma aethiopicum]